MKTEDDTTVYVYRTSIRSLLTRKKCTLLAYFIHIYKRPALLAPIGETLARAAHLFIIDLIFHCSTDEMTTPIASENARLAVSAPVPGPG